MLQDNCTQFVVVTREACLRSKMFMKKCFIAFSLAFKTEWSTSFEFIFAFITSGRVEPVFQMWTSYDLRCAYVRAYIRTLSNTHTCAHGSKALGSEGAVDIAVPWSVQSPKCQGTYRSIRDNVFTCSHTVCSMSLPWLTYLRNSHPVPKQSLSIQRVSLPGAFF